MSWERALGSTLYMDLSCVTLDLVFVDERNAPVDFGQPSSNCFSDPGVAIVHKLLQPEHDNA